MKLFSRSLKKKTLNRKHFSSNIFFFSLQERQISQRAPWYTQDKVLSIITNLHAAVDFMIFALEVFFQCYHKVPGHYSFNQILAPLPVST